LRKTCSSVRSSFPLTSSLVTPENFCFWLQGYLELATAGDICDDLTDEQVKCIKDHLALVFAKVTPDRVGKKKKKVKKINDLPIVGASEVVAVKDVAPPLNPNQISISVEEYLKKKQRKDEDQFIVTCDATPTAETLIDTVKESARKSRETRYNPSPTKWIGGGFGQRYC